MKTLILLAALMTVPGITRAALPTTMPGPAGLAEVKELPNPFTFTDGSQVKTREDWARRREELRTLFQFYEYGPMPPKPQAMTVTPGEVTRDEAANVMRQTIDITLKNDGREMTFHMRLTTPPGATGKLPVILRGAFPARPRSATAPATASTRPVPPSTLPLIMSRNYALAELSFNEIAVDRKDVPRDSGIYKLYGPIDTGALMAWAWGCSRAIDAMEQLPNTDPTRVVVAGHSRYGKAALVAGAFDKRIAITVPHHSGAGGAAPYRFLYGKSEAIHNVVGAFPYWFSANFPQFIGNVTKLPFDQHQLHALVAPRPLMMTEGTEDAWINPQGSQLSYLAAKEVYGFLGSPDAVSIRYRPVGHIPSDEDMLDFADHIFFKKPLPEAFGKLPYPMEPNGFSWKAPSK